MPTFLQVCFLKACVYIRIYTSNHSDALFLLLSRQANLVRMGFALVRTQRDTEHAPPPGFFLVAAPQAGDFLFRQMMDLTLREDKEIIENIYPEYQHGFMNARYDQQVRTGGGGGGTTLNLRGCGRKLGVRWGVDGDSCVHTEGKVFSTLLGQVVHYDKRRIGFHVVHHTLRCRWRGLTCLLCSLCPHRT